MNNPNYYAIIPANIRYNKDLSYLEKFLYCEITALSNADGYCFASNRYFADLYEKDEKTISRAISHIEELGFISLEYDKVGARITKRKINVSQVKNTSDKIVNRTEGTSDKNVTREEEKALFTIRKIVTDNNVSINYILSLIMYNLPKEEKDIIKSFNFSKKLEDIIYEWLAYKRERKEGYKQIGLKRLLTAISSKVDEIGENEVIDGISNSMMANYAGIFYNMNNKPLNQKPQQKSTANFKEREYSKDELKSIFDQVPNIEDYDI